MSASTLHQNSSPPGVRWWPALVVIFLTVLALAWVWLSEASSTQDRVMDSFAVLFFSLLGLFLWLLLLSRMPARRRLAWLAAFGLVFALGATLFEIRGVSGNLVPLLGWRFSGGAAEPEQASGRQVRRDQPVVPGASDYPQFQGPARNAILPHPRLARDWAANPPKQLWRREIGAGWSAFAVAGRAAVTQEQRDEMEAVSRYDLLTGELVWRHQDPARFDSVIGGVGPRATPTIDGDRVYTLGATGLLNALDLNTGESLWSRNVVRDHGAEMPSWGKSNSPLVLDDRVVVAVGGNAGWSLVAYHRETGTVLWHSGDSASGYASPVLLELSGQQQIVSFNLASVSGTSPQDGALLWRYPWSGDQPNVAQPMAMGDDGLLVSSGYGIGSTLLRLAADRNGEINPEAVWSSPRLKAKFANIVQHDGYVYGLDDGVLVCIDPRNGERCWKRGRYGHGQIILVDDLLLIQTESGAVVLVEATPEEHREVARLEALSHKTWNPPALAGRYLLLRNDREAVCYELPIAGGESAQHLPEPPRLDARASSRPAATPSS